MAKPTEPDWAAELTPAPRPRPRAKRAVPEAGGELGEVLERVVAIERMLAEQSVVLAELRAHLGRLTVAAPEPAAPEPARRRRILTPKT